MSDIIVENYNILQFFNYNDVLLTLAHDHFTITINLIYYPLN